MPDDLFGPDWRPRRVTSEIPGPRSIELNARAARVLNHGTDDYRIVPFVQAAKTGHLIVDVDGNEYVDCMAAWGSEPFGAAHPDVRAAMVGAWDRHGAQISLSVLPEPALELAERLVALSPESLTRVEFSVTGTQAVDSTVRLMREATGRPYVIAFGPTYHGNSTAVASALSTDTGETPGAAALFTNGLVMLPYPGTSESPFRPGGVGNDVDTLHYLHEWILRYHLSPSLVAGVLIEPVNTEGGVLVPSDGFWSSLVEMCDRYGWLLAVDEVQTGLGRTGTLFASERWGLQPDLMILGKALSAGGMPISAILGSERVMGRSRFSQGSTFGWTPAACAGALAGLDLLTPELLARVRRMEAVARVMLDPLLRLPHVTRVSALGAEVGVEYDVGGRDASHAFTGRLQAALVDAGVVGIGEDDKEYYRFQPALTLPYEPWRYALAALAAAVADPSLR